MDGLRLHIKADPWSSRPRTLGQMLASVSILDVHDDGGAKIATLDGYEAGIRNLMNMYPQAWDLVVVADEIVRSEGWERLHDEYAKTSPPNFKASMPWDCVIANSTCEQEMAKGHCSSGG